MKADSVAERIAAEFDFGGTPGSVRPHGHGLVNDTFLVEVAGQPKAILQRLNTEVFAHPQWILDNLRVLRAHANDNPIDGVRLPAPFLTRDGSDFFVDDSGHHWRALEFITGSRSLSVLTSAAQARALGLALARFHLLLHELPVDRLHTTLPGFHVTPEYLRHFDDIALDSIADPGVALRDALVFVEERRSFADVLEKARQDGELSLRPTHGDPKLDNILFDAHSDNVVALIDLDTVQPGLVQVDLADCLRSCCNRAGESPSDPFSVRFDVDTAQAILGGYASVANEFWSGADYAYLYDAIRLIPFELGLRFLTDHFAGNRYFRIENPGQNLLRARAQFRLTEDIERQETRLRRIIDSLSAP